MIVVLYNYCSLTAIESDSRRKDRPLTSELRDIDKTSVTHIFNSVRKRGMDK